MMNNILYNLDLTVLYRFLFRAVPALICVVFHEISHGYVSYRLGDETAKTQGRLSLNPLRHIDPLGLLMLIVVGFGWARPVSVNMYNFKNPKRDMAITALAGPVSNILLAFVLLIIDRMLLSAFTFRTGGFTIHTFITTTAQISVYLGVFNLIPIPPLDGSKVLFSILPNSLYNMLMRYERYGMVLLIFLVLSRFFGDYIYIAFSKIYVFLRSIAFFGY